MNKIKDNIDNAINQRFYKYIDIRDKLFLVFAKPLAYFLFKLGLKANSVSIISGGFSIIGGILISFNNRFTMFTGSLFFILFYLFDYVDGIVARLRGDQSVGGQYIDLIMHLVTTISFSLGISIGSLKNEGEFMIPFIFLNVIACALNLSRFSVGWMAIIMKFLENKRSISDESIKLKKLFKKRSIILKIFLRLGSLIFHEDYFIFSLPCILFLNIIFGDQLVFDVRSILLVYGSIFYFPAIVFDILFYADNRIDIYYSKTFQSVELPELPKHIYFN